MDIKDFFKTDDTGKTIVDVDGFNAAFNAELDRARTQASATSAANTEKKLRAEIEKEMKEKAEEQAKLSAEEKLNKAMQDLANERKAFDKQRVSQIYRDCGMSEDEINIMLELIGDDSEKNIENANKIAEQRKKSVEEISARVKEEIQTQTRRGGDSGAGASGGEETSLAKKMAEKLSSKKEDDVVKL